MWGFVRRPLCLGVAFSAGTMFSLPERTPAPLPYATSPMDEPWKRAPGASPTGGVALQELPGIGGHDGMLTDGIHVYKPVQGGRRGRAEVDYYFNTCPPRGRHHAVCEFMPRFFGIATLSRRDDGHPEAVIHDDAARLPEIGSELPQYLVLENLLLPYRHPSQMDVKMGVQAWDEDAPPDKVLKESSKWPTQQVVGFRLTGMRVWQPSSQTWKEHGRTYGYRLNDATLHQAMEEFLHDGEQLRMEVIPPLLEQLRRLQAHFEAQDEHRYYGSSLLVMYEGEAGVAHPGVNVRMIDFAHVWPIKPHEKPHGRDTGYLLGLSSLIRYLEHVQREHRGLT